MDRGAGAELQKAAGVGGDDGLRARGLRVAHFLGKQLQRCFGLREVVNPGGAATDFRVGQFHKFKIRNGAQKRARRFADLLPVEQVTGILISDAMPQGIHFCGKAESGEKFSDIAGFLGESAGLGVFFLVWRKEMIVFLECGAATGGVGDDGIELFVGKRCEICSCKIARGIADTGMSGQRAATKLILGDNDFAAVGGEHADGGLIEIRKYDIGDAAGEEGDTGAARAGCWIGFAQTAKEKIIVDPRQEAFLLGDAEKFQDADAAGNGLQAGALIQTKQAGGVREVKRTGQQSAENEIARDASDPGAGIFALNARAGVLDEFAVLDAGGAGGLAGAAVQAFVNVIDKGIGDGQLALLDVDHLADAAARGIRFQIPEAIGGAGVEA